MPGEKTDENYLRISLHVCKKFVFLLLFQQYSCYRGTASYSPSRADNGHLRVVTLPCCLRLKPPCCPRLKLLHCTWGMPYLFVAIGLCIQDGTSACREVQSKIHLPQIPRDKLHIAQCCHPEHLVSCKLPKVKKPVYQQRDLCFLCQLLRPMRLIPHKSTHLDRPLAMLPVDQDHSPHAPAPHPLLANR